MSSSDTTIKETCSCSATFTYNGYYTHAADEVAKWRRDHRHEMPTQPEVDVEALLREGLSAKGRLELWQEQERERDPRPMHNLDRPPSRPDPHADDPSLPPPVEEPLDPNEYG